MNHKPILTATLAGLLLSAIPCPQTKAENSFWETIGIGAGIGAAVAAGACAISWACTPSDEEALYQAQKADQGVWGDYSSIKGYHYNDAQESVYDIAAYYFRDYQPAYSSYVYKLNSAISSLRGHVCELQKRMRKNRKSNAKNDRVYYKMSDLEIQLNQTINELSAFAAYLKKHESYFILYQYEDRLMTQYQQELEALAAYKYDHFTLENAFRACVIKHEPHKHVGYAYEQFVSRLGDNIQTLQTRIYNARAYQNRSTQAQDLAAKLSSIEQTILASADYIHAMNAYQSYLQQQAILEAERAQARAAEQRARLERERLYAQEERNRIERERLYAERERNRIERERLENERYRVRPVVYVPAPEFHVHI
jgi:hypothetical protein